MDIEKFAAAHRKAALAIIDLQDAIDSLQEQGETTDKISCLLIPLVSAFKENVEMQLRKQKKDLKEVKHD